MRRPKYSCCVKQQEYFQNECGAMEGSFKGTFRRAPHGMEGGRGGFLSKSGNEFSCLVNSLDKRALVW